MRGVLVAAWLSWALRGVPVSGALTLVKKDAPAVLSVPFAHRQVAGSGDRQALEKRGKWVNVDSDIESATFFHANILVGTPGQNITVTFATWGNECWIDGANSTDCELWTNHESCGGYGGYNLTQSSTAHWVSGGLNVDGGVTGDFVNDTITLGGAEIDSMKLGVSYRGITSSTLGLGYGESNSTSVSLTEALVQAGIINTPAFSMWMAFDQDYELWDSFEGRGNILFGGVDKSQYIEPIYTLPVVPGATGLRKAFRVNITDITLNGTSVFPTSSPVDAVLDNELSSVYMPEAMAKAIYDKVGATENVTDDTVTIPCDAGYYNSTFEFNFGGNATYVFDLANFVGQDDGGEICDFGFRVNRKLQNEGTIVLGSYFLKGVYSVFDMENNEVSFAYRNWGNDSYSSSAQGDDIVEITSGSSGQSAVPGATKAGSEGGTESTKKSIGVRVEGFGLQGVLMMFAFLCFNI